jgi:hypothetical protein
MLVTGEVSKFSKNNVWAWAVVNWKETKAATVSEKR